MVGANFWTKVEILIEKEVKRQLELMKDRRNTENTTENEEFNANKARNWQIAGRKKVIAEELKEILEFLEEEAKEGRNGIVRTSLYEDTKAELRRRGFVVDLMIGGDYRIFWDRID